ncbi:hypothetical protein N500_0706, partial [Wolbachia pipientis wUni]
MNPIYQVFILFSSTIFNIMNKHGKVAEWSKAHA